MFLNDFFNIVKTNLIGRKIISIVSLNPSHGIYLGHFPENPITPGVVQVQMVKEILEVTYKKNLRIVSISRCNFLNILNPNETPIVTIEIISSENPLQISAVGTENGKTYFKLSALFSDELSTN